MAAAGQSAVAAAGAEEAGGVAEVAVAAVAADLGRSASAWWALGGEEMTGFLHLYSM